jgi:hypothetical protein
MKGNHKLSTRQAKALNAIFRSNSIHQAAKAAQVGVNTIYRWMTQPYFMDALIKMEQDFQISTSRRLMGLSSEAINTLAEILNDGDPEDNVRLRAAQLIIEKTIETPVNPQSAARDDQRKDKA